MTFENDSDLPFTIDKEQSDALRLDTQTQTPKEREEFENRLKAINQDFLTIFGKYIPKDKHLTHQQITQKFHVSDKETSGAFNKEWKPKKEGQQVTQYSDVANLMTQHILGNLVIGDIFDVWAAVDSQSQEILTREHGSTDAAKRYTLIRFEEYAVAHEIAHLYQENIFPVWFDEIAADWYATKLTQEKFLMPANKARADFFQTFVAKYGNTIHRTFFGDFDMGGDTLAHIYRNFTPEIRQKLFPNYKTFLWKS